MPRAISLRKQSFCLGADSTTNALIDSNRSSAVSITNENSNEAKYTIGLWTGIAINVSMVFVYISYYGMYCMKRDVGHGDLVCYTLVNFLSFVSACFLGDAMRRFYLTFKNLRGIHTNEKVMVLHLAIFLTYFVITLLKTIQVGKWFQNKSDQASYRRALIEYTICLWFLFIDQFVLTYLFYILGRP